MIYKRIYYRQRDENILAPPLSSSSFFSPIDDLVLNERIKIKSRNWVWRKYPFLHVLNQYYYVRAFIRSNDSDLSSVLLFLIDQILPYKKKHTARKSKNKKIYICTQINNLLFDLFDFRKCILLIRIYKKKYKTEHAYFLSVVDCRRKRRKWK